MSRCLDFSKQALESGTPLVTADSQVSYRFMIKLNATNLFVPLAFGNIQYDPSECYTTRLSGCDTKIGWRDCNTKTWPWLCAIKGGK